MMGMDAIRQMFVYKLTKKKEPPKLVYNPLDGVHLIGFNQITGQDFPRQCKVKNGLPMFGLLETIAYICVNHDATMVFII